MNPWEIITSIAVAAGVALSALIQYSGRNQWQGDVGARLNYHDKAIEKIEVVNQRQWDAIGEHSEDIAALKVVRKPNGHHGSL